MKRKYKMLVGIISALILIIILLSWGRMIWYDSDFEADYSKQHLTLTGDFAGGTFEYKKLSIYFADYQEYDSNGRQEASPIKKIYKDIPFILHIGKDSFKAVDIKPTDMQKLGAKFDKPSSNGIIWASIRSPYGFSPPYSLHCGFFKDQIFTLNFSIVTPPNPAMAKPKPCPISFSFGTAKKVTFPIARKKIEEYLGAPTEVRRYMKFP